MTILILLSGCLNEDYSKKDFEFSKVENEFFAAYHVGDTIYFKSNKNNVDIFTVIGFGIEQRRASGGLMNVFPINTKWIKIKHLPVDNWAQVSIETSNNKADTNYQGLFWITKKPTFKNITSYSIDFKDFYTNPATDSAIGEFHTDTIKVNDHLITDYYIVRHGYPNRVIDSSNIEVVYWTKANGLTAYKNKGGEVWTKQYSR
jgi:hypothetical protein